MMLMLDARVALVILDNSSAAPQSGCQEKNTDMYCEAAGG
jgi:hypothetical protein